MQNKPERRAIMMELFLDIVFWIEFAAAVVTLYVFVEDRIRKIHDRRKK